MSYKHKRMSKFRHKAVEERVLPTYKAEAGAPRTTQPTVLPPAGHQAACSAILPKCERCQSFPLHLWPAKWEAATLVHMALQHAGQISFNLLKKENQTKPT